MATHNEIISILTSNDFSAGEKFIVKMQFRHHIQVSNFEEKLWEFMCACDGDNLGKLQVSFPEQVNAYMDWRMGDLGNRLRKAGCPI